MKLKQLTLLTTVCTLALLLVSMYTCGPDEEYRLRTRINELQSMLKLEEGLHPLAKMTKVADLMAFAIAPFTLQFDDPERSPIVIEHRRELKTRLTAAINSFDGLEAQLTIESIDIDSDKATVNGIVSALGNIKGEGQFFDRHRISLLWAKIKDDWQLYKLIHQENLRDAAK